MSHSEVFTSHQQAQNNIQQLAPLHQKNLHVPVSCSLSRCHARLLAIVLHQDDCNASSHMETSWLIMTCQCNTSACPIQIVL
jgi:hypothetical protein